MKIKRAVIVGEYYLITILSLECRQTQLTSIVKSPKLLQIVIKLTTKISTRNSRTTKHSGGRIHLFCFKHDRDTCRHALHLRLIIFPGTVSSNLSFLYNCDGDEHNAIRCPFCATLVSLLTGGCEFVLAYNERSSFWIHNQVGWKLNLFLLIKILRQPNVGDACGVIG